MDNKIKTRKEELKRDLNALSEKYQSLLRETTQVQNAILQFEGAYRILEELVPSEEPKEESDGDAVVAENSEENKLVKRAKKAKAV